MNHQFGTTTESTAEERASFVVRLATRAFGDGSRAAAWLSKANARFGERAPLELAKESATECARICQFLDELAID